MLNYTVQSSHHRTYEMLSLYLYSGVYTLISTSGGVPREGDGPYLKRAAMLDFIRGALEIMI